MFVFKGWISVNKTNPAIRWTVIYLVDSVIQRIPAGPGVLQELTLNLPKFAWPFYGFQIESV